MRLYRLILLMLFLSVVTLVAARLAGGLHPKSSLSAVLSDPNGIACVSPCLFGIQPGVTSVNQAVVMLRAHPLTRDGYWVTRDILKLAGGTAFVEFSETVDGLVDSIALTDNLVDTGDAPAPGSLLDSLKLGNVNEAIDITYVYLPGSDVVVVGNPDAGLVVGLARSVDFSTYIYPETPLKSMMISVFRACPQQDDAITDQVHPWMGFTSIEHYYDDSRESKIRMRLSGVSIPPYAVCQE